MKIPKLAADYFFISVVTMTIAIFPAAGAWGKQAFDLVSLNNEGTAPSGTFSSNHSKVTPDGRFVVFRSNQPLFHPSNIPLDKSQITSGYQIFLRDRKLGNTELISINHLGEYGNNDSDWPTISDDGCRVAYQSAASNLVTGDNNDTADIFLRDRCATPSATTTRVNLNYSGAQSSGAADTPYLSGDGKFVVFNADGNDLVQGITGQSLLYLRDLDKQQTTLVSESVVNAGTGQAAYNPSISSVNDGTATPLIRIAFSSASKELVTTVQPDGWNVFLYDSKANPHLKLVSADAGGTPQLYTGQISANGDMPHPGISADGHYVSFYSNATNLVPSDANNFYDVFVKNVDTAAIWRANVSSTGAEANADTQFNSSLSQDGTWVSFYASASNLTSTPNISKLIVLHNIFTGETLRVSGTAPEDYPAISGDQYGRYISNFWGDKTLDSRFNSSGIFFYDRHNLPVATIANIDSITQPIQVGDAVTLDGSGSNNNANSSFFAPKPTPSLVYKWTQTAGTSVTLSDPHAAKPSFTIPADGIYSFRLVVTDTIEDSAAATVTVQVGNLKPIANAGPDQTGAIIGNKVDLNGSQSSDPDDGPSPLSYSWTQIAGKPVHLSDSTTATPSFTPTSFMSSSYSFRLVVNDGKYWSAPDVVTITIGTATSNAPPVAITGDNQTATQDNLVTLDGSQSFDPNTPPLPLSYQWTQIGGPSVALSGASKESPSFTPSTIGSYSFKLVVNDGTASSLGSVVTVTVKSATSSNNQIPVAVAGIASTRKIVGSAIKLKGSDSHDPDRKPKRVLKYQWVQRDGPAPVKLLGANTSAPKFTAKQPGDYVFDLAVFDGADWSTTESVTVHIDATINVSTPTAGDIWPLGAKQTISYQTSGINPATPLTAYLYLVNAQGSIYSYVFTIKHPAKASASFALILPVNASSLKTQSAMMVLCVTDNFCGNSRIFTIQ